MISVSDIFKIGIGPSSSHTIGPMKAAASFMRDVEAIHGGLGGIRRLVATLYGSLAWTGRGHSTDKAIILGFTGALPDRIDPDEADRLVVAVTKDHRLALPGGRMLAFDPNRDIVFDFETQFERHPNAMRFAAIGEDPQEPLADQIWFSVGGGFVVREGDENVIGERRHPVTYPFGNAATLLELGEVNQLSIAQIVEANELSQRPADDLEASLQTIASTMFACIERGLSTRGDLPGHLKVKRRAADIAAKLEADGARNFRHAHEVMDRVSCWAIAVNEENAAGGRIVTAPTNGAAGVVPAVLRYYRDFCPGADQDGIRTFLLTATAIGALYKLNASISGAEVGCQGEVGVACSMAAAGLCAALGGTNMQTENAAEIGMEHHLGMTCDPVGGLVQIPCIERNAFGAIKAINAAGLALRGDGTHRVSLDQVIVTMRQTGEDMQSKYKETSLGGLAVNFTEC